jgi:predicted nucleic acid-binding protein
MRAAVNASPLIFLSKLGMLDCLRLYERIYTTQIVIDEIKRGMDRGYQESLSVQKLVNEGFIIIGSTSKPKEGFGLDPGELSVIEMAKYKKIKEILLDDRSANKVAKYFGLKVVSTPFLLLKNLKLGIIELDEFKDAMERLIGFGYFISPNLYIDILKTAESL